MTNLENIKNVIKKLTSINELSEHLCYFGGAASYLFFNQESNREHTDLDVLVDEKYMPTMRELVKQNFYYNPELDSLNLGLDNDYGLKTFIDGVYIEFEPMNIENEVFTRKSFSPSKKVAGIEQIPFENLEDIITTTKTGDAIISFQSVEMIKAQKEIYKREKDLLDIAFIDNQGIDFGKYERVKKSMQSATYNIISYEKPKETEITK